MTKSMEIMNIFVSRDYERTTLAKCTEYMSSEGVVAREAKADRVLQILQESETEEAFLEKLQIEIDRQA